MIIETFCKAYEKWDASSQFLFAGIVCICLVTLIILGAIWALNLFRSFCEYVAVLRHGWPNDAKPVVPNHRPAPDDGPGKATFLPDPEPEGDASPALRVVGGVDEDRRAAPKARRQPVKKVPAKPRGKKGPQPEYETVPLDHARNGTVPGWHNQGGPSP